MTTLLPTALPSARLWLPVKNARALTASSGIDVPNATSSRPVTNGDQWKRRESPDAPFSTESPPSARKIRASTHQPSAMIIAPSPS